MYRDLVLAASPVGYWRLEDDLTDESGNGHDGSIRWGAEVYAAGLIDGGGKSFDADNANIIEIDTVAAAMKGAPGGTLEAWVQHNGDTDTASQYVVSLRDDSGPHMFQFLRLYASDVFRLRVDAGGGTALVDVDLALLDDGQAHHVVGTYDGQVVRVYVDGLLEASDDSLSGTIDLSGTTAGAIAGYPFTEQGHWNGQVDEVAVYDRALTHAEVLEHYRAGKLAELAASGLLARHEAGDADFPFDVDDWSTTGGALDLDASGNLRIQPQGAGRLLTHEGITSRSKAMTFARVRMAYESVANYSIGPGFHQPDADNHVDQRYYAADGGDEYYGITETVAGVFNAIDQAPQGEVDLETARDIWGFVDGAACLMEDWEGGQWSGNSQLTSGPLGLYARSTHGTAYLYCEAFFVCTDRYLEVTGLPENILVEVLDAADAVLASASADGSGVATVDLLGVAFPDPAKVRLGGGVATFEPALGVWAGDSYDASGVTFNEPPETPTVTAEPTTDGVDLEGSAFSDPDGDAHQASQWQVDVAAGDFSAPVADEATGPLEAHSIELVDEDSYIARVRYQDDQGEWSEWSDPTAPFDAPAPIFVQVARPVGSLVQVERPECGNYDALVLADNPVGYYRFLESSIDDPLEDELGLYDGYYQDGALGVDDCSSDNAASLVDGPLGGESRAVYAAGPDSRARFMAMGGWGDTFWDVDENHGIDFTVELWARPEASLPSGSAGTCPQSEALHRNLLSGIFSDPGRDFGFHLGTDRCIVAGRGPNDCAASEIVEADLTGWHHYVFLVHRGREVDLYLDGELVGSSFLSGLEEDLRLKNTVIWGKRYAANDDCGVQPDPWVGAIAELALYDYHLSVERIQAHASAQGAGSCFEQVARPEGSFVLA